MGGPRNAKRVIVVGAGPVGCTAAAVLARRGVATTILEAQTTLRRERRASTFHPATLDLLDSLGVTPELLKLGLVAPSFAYRDRRSGPVATFHLEWISEFTNHPYRLQCEQFKLCETLIDRFEADPLTDTRFGCRVTAASDHGDHAVVELADGTTLRADFLIAADGAGSAVRKSLALAFDGMTYEDRYLVVSTTHDFGEDFDDLCYVNYISDPAEWLVLLRTLSSWRALFPVAEGESDSEALSEESVQRRLRGVTGRGGRYEVVHRTVYRVHQRVAGSFRRGRVILAGDAAHINNPLGGMGMNGGIHDAVGLGEAIAGVCSGELGDESITRMAEHRRRMAIDYVGRHTHRNAVSLTAPDGALRQAALEQMAATAAEPAAARDYILQASMIKALWSLEEALDEMRPARAAARSSRSPGTESLID